MHRWNSCCHFIWLFNETTKQAAKAGKRNTKKKQKQQRNILILLEWNQRMLKNRKQMERKKKINRSEEWEKIR